jgi:hypothetical protein
MTACGGEGHLRGVHCASNRKQFVSCARLRSSLNYVISGLDGAWTKQPDGLAGRFNVLDHQDGISAWRDWRAGHNLPNVAFGERPGGSVTGAGCARELQEGVCRGFRCPAGETVTRGAREGRLVGVGMKRLGKDASKSEAEFDAFNPRCSAGGLERLR